MRCLIVGDGQFLDNIIAKELLLSGSDVALVSDKAPIEEIAEDTVYLEGDVDSVESLQSEINEFKPETIIHLSLKTEAHVDTLCALAGANIDHLIVASSANVYKANAVVYETEIGDLDNAPISEKALLRSEPLIEDSNLDRVDMEKRLSKLNMPLTMLRLPPVYGPGDNLYRLLPSMSRMLEDRPFIVVAESQADWRWTHAYSADIAHGFVLLALNPSEENRVFNIGESITPSIIERISHLATVIGWDGRIVALPDDKLPKHIVPNGNFDQNLELDSSSIRNAIGYREITDYYDGLNETIEWYKANLPEMYRDPNFDYESEDALKSLVDKVVESE